ncbi:zona pellucida sperm-binding protein 1-like [Hyla sarda]|uniref:zona pellucida sperm-binding protein 1-like n=1 Tax=Hyla sarda TaxID=327740 RepID=UPI0024C3B433|nr:zona pellucida sperm-binding protein 1-like [Hyla sarda]
MHHTPRSRTTRSMTTTSYPGRTTESSVITGPPRVTPTTPTDDHGLMVNTTTKEVSTKPSTTKISPKVTSLGPTELGTTLKSSDILTPPQCSVPTGRITCLNASVPRDTCLDNRCCHDPIDSISPCYYGHTVTVHCSPDGLFRLILSRYATNPPLRLSSVVLGPGNCPSPTILGDFLEFQGYLSLCSGRRSVKGRLVYELSLTAKQDVLFSSLGSITRDSSFTVLSQCLYNNTLSNVSLVVLPFELPTVTSTGILSVELRISKGSSFSSFYASEDFPLPIPLREFVYLEARLLQPSDPRLHLRLHHCWGAPSLDPAVTLHWPVIDDGCPFSDDDTLTRILPTSVPSSYQRFAVSAFTFLNFQYNTQVYFFCSVSVCLPSPSESCTSDCANLTRSRRAHPDDALLLVGTAGPLVFQQERTLGAAGLQHLTSTLPGIVFAVTFLLIVLLLVAALKVKSGFMMSKNQLNPQ